MKTLASIWALILTWILHPIGKFPKFIYAPEITIAVYGVFKLFKHPLFGILVLVWAVLLAFNEYKQSKTPTV
jgi:hypothetical protein